MAGTDQLAEKWIFSCRRQIFNIFYGRYMILFTIFWFLSNDCYLKEPILQWLKEGREEEGKKSVVSDEVVQVSDDKAEMT